MSSEQQSDQAASNLTSPNGSLIGYCHQCDRQVEIDPDFYTCRRCNSGFIELFEGNDEASADEAAETEINNPHSRVFRFDAGGPADFEQLANQFLPLLFPQLINQARSNQNTSSGDIGAGGGGGASSAAGAPASGGIGASTAQPRNAQIQFFVPAGENAMNEQIDLYGIINNVVSDLLNQRSTNNNPFFLHQPYRMFQLHGNAGDYAWGPGGLDTIITQLLNQLENTGPPPATDDDMRKLPTVIITEQDVENKVQCAICMEEFAAKAEAKKLPCKHLFHEACIVQWLQRHGTCPVCRKHLNGEDTTQNEYVSPAANVEAGAASTNSEGGNNNTQAAQSSTTSTDNSSSSTRNTTSGDNAGSNNLYTDMDFD